MIFDFTDLVSPSDCRRPAGRPRTTLAENDWGGLTVTEFRSSHGMEEGKGERYLASGRRYGSALLGVCHPEEEDGLTVIQAAVFCRPVFFLILRMSGAVGRCTYRPMDGDDADGDGDSLVDY